MINQARLTIFLLRPSLTSGTVCLILAISMLLVGDWAFVQQSGLHDFLYGNYGIVTTLNDSPNGFRALVEGVFVHQFGREIKTFIFVFLIGLCVYSVLEIINRFITGVENRWVDLRTAPPAFRQRLNIEAWEKFWFRTAILIGWFLYSSLFIGILLPFCISASRYFVGTFPMWPGSGYGVLALVLLWISLHIHVVIMRFVALRPRLFGSVDTLLLMK